MKFNHPLLLKIGGCLGSMVIRFWMGTLDTKVLLKDPRIDPSQPDCLGPNIYLLWHEYMMLPICARPHCNISMLVSRHVDAELLSHIGRHMGFDVVRGSSARRGWSRGGETAIRQMMRKASHMHLAFTPDGPQGPRRKMSTGPIYVASKLGIPLVAFGVGFDRPWRMPTWDRFCLPRPFSRGRVIVSNRFQIPPNLSRAGIQHYRLETEKLMEQLHEEAECWANSGTQKEGQKTTRCWPLPSRYRRVDSAHSRLSPNRRKHFQTVTGASRSL